MAHANYDCCAICDTTLDYAGLQAETKERVCDTCLDTLKNKFDVSLTNHYDLTTLKQWMDTLPDNDLKEVLITLNFRFCYYDNDIDHYIMHRFNLTPSDRPYGKSFKEVITLKQNENWQTSLSQLQTIASKFRENDRHYPALSIEERALLNDAGKIIGYLSHLLLVYKNTSNGDKKLEIRQKMHSIKTLIEEEVRGE